MKCKTCNKKFVRMDWDVCCSFDCYLAYRHNRINFHKVYEQYRFIRWL